MPSPKPEVGTVIYLRTGSPPMVVNSQRDDALVSAEWFTLDGVLHRDAFDLANIFVEPPELEHMRHKRANNMKARMGSGNIPEVVGDRGA